MADLLAEFISALRAQDVRVSTSETIDAGETVAAVGWDDRQVLRDSLGIVLAKTPEEKETFDDTFDRFFSFDAFKDQAPEDAGGGAPEDAQKDEAQGDDGAGGQEGDDSAPGDLLELMQSGDQAALQAALAAAARAVGASRVQLFTQKGLFTRRIMEEMGLEALDQAIIDAEREVRREEGEGGSAAEERFGRLKGLRENLRREVADFMERQIELQTANAGRQLREEVLSRIKLSNIERRDFKLMRELVRKMAKRLVALHSRRRKVARRGHLDVRKTIRKNIEYDGLLFDIVWKRTKIDRPKVVAVCDVSGSVAAVSRFLLMFLYSLTEVLPTVRAFAFSGRLGEVTDLFKEKKIEDAIAETLQVHGGGSTDYGMAFADLEELVLDDIDHKTTVIVLGDARSNYGDPRADILHKISERCRQVIWLNPEPGSLWGTGDSEMPRLRPYCHKAEVCNSLQHLERVVSGLLRTAV